MLLTDAKNIAVGDETLTERLEYLGNSMNSMKLGDFKYSAVSKDRADEGLLGFQFDKVSISLYPELYAEVGDIFEQAHIGAGQGPSGASYF